VSTGSLAHLATLDERWLAFVTRTADVFAAHPGLIPLRQTFFKLMIEQQTTLSLAKRARHWAGFAMKRQHSAGDTTPVDVVFWLDNTREVLVEAILPVYRAALALGVGARSIVTPPVAAHLDAAVTPVQFHAPYRRAAGHRWRPAWDDLLAALPGDLAPRGWSAFLVQAAVAESLAHEMERVLLRLRPKVLVLPIDQLLPGGTACTVARRLGIASLVLMHGAPLPYNVPLTADKMAVWGAVSLDQLTSLGVPRSDLVVLGSPRHDQFPTGTAQEARSRFRQALNLGDSRYMVFFSNGNDVRRNSVEAVEGCAAWLDAAAQQLAGRVEIVVRLHPNEDGRYYAPYPLLRVFKNECDLDTTLHAADVCGALCSTVLSDALLYQKPVLQFYADGWPDLADNWRRGLAERIASPQTLIDVLRSSLDDPQPSSKIARRQQAVVSTVFANHPHAAEAVARYISETYL
jgi:hypothetical protein